MATIDDATLRAAVGAAESLFADGDLDGARDGLEAVRSLAAAGSPVWAEAMSDLAVVFHARGELGDAYAHAQHALRAAPALPEAQEAAAICAEALGVRGRSRAPEGAILIVVENFAPSVGGTEMLAADLARALTRRGRATEVLCHAHPARIPGAHETPVHETEPEDAAAALARLLASGRFGGVVGISAPSGFPVHGLLALPHPLDGVRSLVVPCINQDGDRRLRANRAALARYARGLLRVDAVGYSSHGGWDRRLLDDLGVPGSYLPNAVAALEPVPGLRRELGVPSSTPVILHVANIWPEKNHLGFLEELRGAPGDWRVVSIGGPSDVYPELAKQVADAASRDPRVRLLGPRTREQVAGAMAEADVLVLPSTAEATPLVLLEAMSHGLPWIASDTCGSAADLAGGEIVSQGGFAAALELLCSDADRRAALGREGRAAYRAEYSWERVAPRYLAALDGLAGARAAA